MREKTPSKSNLACMMYWLKPQTSPRFGLSHSKRRTKIHFSTVSCLRIHLRQLQALLQNLDCFTFAIATKFTILLQSRVYYTAPKFRASTNWGLFVILYCCKQSPKRTSLLLKFTEIRRVCCCYVLVFFLLPTSTSGQTSNHQKIAVRCCPKFASVRSPKFPQSSHKNSFINEDVTWYLYTF